MKIAYVGRDLDTRKKVTVKLKSSGHKQLLLTLINPSNFGFVLVFHLKA